MDLSFLKWPIVILVIGSLGFLISSPGIEYVYGKATAGTVGADPEADTANEATLSRLAGLELATFRYKRASEIYDAALKRFPNGKNSWHNWYQLARCFEKLEQFDKAVDILVMLRDENADKQDERVASPTQLDARIQKLVEVHELPARPWAH